MNVRELRAILCILNDDTEINIEWQEGTRKKAGRIALLNSVEIEEDFNCITLKALANKDENKEGNA